MPAPDHNAQSIFGNALDLPEAERAAYLAAACADDGALRAEVEELLGAHAQAAAFLAPNAAGERPTATMSVDQPTATSAVSEPSGAGGAGEGVAGVVLAGRYKLLEPVGSGGMGSVWMAQQIEPVRRLVAVKLIRAGMDSRSVLARFEAERQALALMDHPNIAKVLDAGTAPDGRPFFVMELVKGVPITQFCDERKLAPKERLGLFVSVCRAIEHAHQKGVIHRDIKPSNVLVTLYDDHPVPKVIDFGVAKAAGEPLTDHTLHTGFGMVVGTLQYMAPEQAAFNNLDVDTRADVYGLGALLYELLAGSPPFAGPDFQRAAVLEALRVVREDEPPRPSTRVSTGAGRPVVAAARGMEPNRLAGLLRADLDWVVMKALEKDRGRRYQSAGGFAADVERYLAGEAVQAVPPSALYRARKFVRRHRPAVIMAAVLALVGATGATGTAVGMVQVAETERKAAVDRATLAEDNERSARAAGDKARTLTEMLQELLGSANPARLGPGYTVAQMLDDYEPKLGDKLRDQPEVEADLRRTIGWAYLVLDQSERSAFQFERVLALRRATLPPDHTKIAEALTDLAGVLTEQLSDRPFTQVEYARRARRAAVLAEEAVGILRPMSGEQPEGLVEALISHGRAIDARDDIPLRRNEQALAAFREALEIARRCPGARGQELISRSIIMLAPSYEDVAEAIAQLKTALSIRHAHAGELSFSTAQAHVFLGEAHLRAHDYPTAENEFRLALKMHQGLFAGSKKRWAAYALQQLVFTLAVQYKDEDVEAELRKCPPAWQAESFRFPLGDRVAFAWGEACFTRGDYADTVARSRTALDLASTPAGPVLDVAAREDRFRLGCALAVQEKFAEAREVLAEPLRQARDVAAGTRPANIPGFFHATQHHLWVLLFGGLETDLRAAVNLIDRWRQKAPAAGGERPSVETLECELICRFYLGEYETVAAGMSKVLAVGDPWNLEFRRTSERYLVAALEHAEDPAGAERVLRAAVTYCEGNLSAGHPETAANRALLAEFLSRQRRYAEAVEEFTKAYDLLTAHPAASGWSLVRRRAAVVDRLVETHAALGNANAAGEWCTRFPLLPTPGPREIRKEETPKGGS